MLLREYLYVDGAAVRGLLAQIESGVAESETQTEKSEKRSGAGLKGIAEHSRSWAGDTTTAKSLGDGIFPRLEDALEVEGLLEDVSELVQTPDAWVGGGMRSVMPPGKVVRITAPGWLMDSRVVASMLTGFAVTQRGLVNMGVIGSGSGDQTNLPPKAKVAQKRNAYKELPNEAASMEGAVPLGKLQFGADADFSLSGEFLRGIIQVTRGMFAPGLHLSLLPEVEGAGAIVLRLQEGRQFLDTDPDILFARYGVGVQEWTVVGTVGHHALPSPDFKESSFMEDDSIKRADFARYVLGLGTMLGNLGFTDVAQEPGFSIVPWAVYRTIGSPGD